MLLIVSKWDLNLTIAIEGFGANGVHRSAGRPKQEKVKGHFLHSTVSICWDAGSAACCLALLVSFAFIMNIFVLENMSCALLAEWEWKPSHKPFPLLSSYRHLRRITVMSVSHLIHLPSCSVIHQLCVFSQHFLRTRRCISHSDQVPGPAGRSCWTCGVCTLQHFPKVNVGQALFSSIIRMSAGRSFDGSSVSCCHRMKMKHRYHTPSPAPFFQPLFQRHEGNLKVRCYHIPLSFSLISSP